MSLEYRSPTADELDDVLAATFTAFGEELVDEQRERLRRVLELDRTFAAWDDGRPVGTTGSWPFELTVPGGTVRAAGVTLVGVVPSHRRRGVMSELMRLQLDDVHERGEPVAVLWASEAPIYGRFGYGIAAPEWSIDAERRAFALRDDPGPRGSVRLVSADEALELFPPLFENRRRERPGTLSRSRSWWHEGELADPEYWRQGAGPKYYALLELDGEPAGYAIYRVRSKWEEGAPRGDLLVQEAFATSPEATGELWRFLFGVDLVERVKHQRVDPSLLLMVADTRRLHVSLAEGLWLRFVDLEAAFRARSFNDAEEVVLEVEDGLFERNAGRWLVGAEPRRTDRDADVAIRVDDLASAYLGAFGFERLALAGRVRELRSGGAARAGALFATSLPPWCPHGF